MKVSTLSSSNVLASDGNFVHVGLPHGETAIYLRDHYDKLLTKQWRMEDAFVHTPWRSIPDNLPLVSRLWMYVWMQRSMQQREDITIRHGMLRQWGFTESPEGIRKALNRMEQKSLLKIVRSGREQLNVLLNEPRPPSKMPINVAAFKATSNDLASFLGGPSEGSLTE